MSLLSLSTMLALALADWEAPADVCPSESELEQRIEAFSGQLIEPAYRARVEPVEGGFRLTLTVSREDVEVQRTLFDTDCHALAEATALAVASLAVPATAPSAPAESEEREPQPLLPRGNRHEIEREEPIPRPIAPPAPARQELGFRALAGVGADVGVAGTIASAARLGISLDGKWLSGAFVGTVLGPRTLRRGAAAASVVGVLAGVRGCVRLLQRQVSIPVCIGGAAGALVAEPQALQHPVRRRVPIASLDVSARLEWSFHPRFALFAALEGSAHFVRPRVEYTQTSGDPALLHQVPRLGVRPLMGLSATIWSRE